MFQAPQSAAPLAEIVLKSFKVGKRTFQPADKLDRVRLLADPAMDDRTLGIMDRQNYFGPLNRHNYSIAVARREPQYGKMGNGFTEAFLAEAGIIDREAAAPAPAGLKVEIKPGTAIPYGDFLIVPVKNGRFVQFEATTQSGELLRPSRFRSQENAQKFIDEVVEAAKAQALTQSPAPEAAGQEKADDDDVRSDAGGPDQSGSPGDR